MIRVRTGLLMLALVASAAGCSSQTDSEKAASEKQPDAKKETAAQQDKPVTLKVLYPSWLEFVVQNVVEVQLKKELPHITLEKHVSTPNDRKQMEAMAASGFYPDLIMTAGTTVDLMLEMNYTTDMLPLFKQFNLNIDSIDPNMIKSVNIHSGRSNELIGVPFLQTFGALYYNKDIFDKFGVPYPADGLTWDDAIELSKRLTRVDNGVQYMGLDPGAFPYTVSQLSLPFIDAKTKKAAVNNEDYKKLYELYQRISHPGNKIGQTNQKWLNERVVAMHASLSGMLRTIQAAGMNWDMTTYPTHKQAPGIGPGVDYQLAAVTRDSKQKEAAFQVVKMLLSENTQTALSKGCEVSVLSDSKALERIRASLCQDIPGVKGKNLSAAFKTKMALPHAGTKWDSQARNLLNGEILTKISVKGSILIRLSEKRTKK